VSLDSVTLHNVAEAVPDGDGHLLQRIPDDVRAEINEGAAATTRAPAGVEVRFETEETPVEVTLSAPSGTRAFRYWGPLRLGPPVDLGSEPTAVEVNRPSELDRLRPDAIDSTFDTRCARIRFDPIGRPLRFHGIEPHAAVSPPAPALTPDTRIVYYGTSITQGANATGPHLTYPAQVARRLGWDPINLGTSGSAHCDAALADYIASLEWDVAVLALSVNMCSQFPVDEFRTRASYFVETVAESGRPVAAITLFPHSRDLVSEAAQADDATAYRATLREIAAEAPDNVTLIEGADLLDPAGLTADLIHPADEGMIGLGERLAAELAPLTR